MNLADKPETSSSLISAVRSAVDAAHNETTEWSERAAFFAEVHTRLIAYRDVSLASAVQASPSTSGPSMSPNVNAAQEGAGSLASTVGVANLVAAFEASASS